MTLPGFFMSLMTPRDPPSRQRRLFRSLLGHLRSFVGRPVGITLYMHRTSQSADARATIKIKIDNWIIIRHYWQVRDEWRWGWWWQAVQNRSSSRNAQCCDLETMVSRLECTRVHFVQVSVFVSRLKTTVFLAVGAFLCALTVLVWDQQFCRNLCMLSASCNAHLM